MTDRFRQFSHHQRAFQNALWSAANYIRRGEHLFNTVREHLDLMTKEAQEHGDDSLLGALEASRQQLATLETRLDRLSAILEDHRAPSAAAEPESTKPGPRAGSLPFGVFSPAEPRD